MSFAMGVVQKDFIITTSDSAVVNFAADKKIFEETGEIVPGEMIGTDIKRQKTCKISDNVILILTGLSVLTEAFKVELSEQVSANTTLKEAIKIARDVLTGLKKKKVKNLDKIISNLQAQLPITDDVDFLKEEFLEIADLLSKKDPRDLTAYLVGFNKDGTSGSYHIVTDNYMEKSEDENKGYPVAVAGSLSSKEDESLYYNTLTFPVGERTLDNFITAMSYVHAHNSFKNNINISPDCNFRILAKLNGQVKYTEFTLDTSKLYGELSVKEESQ